MLTLLFGDRTPCIGVCRIKYKRCGSGRLWSQDIPEGAEKESIVYFSDEVRDVLETYLDERQAIDAFQVMRMLCSCPCRKKRMSVRTVENMVKKICGSCYSPKKITPISSEHLRHQPLPGNRRYLSGSIGPWAQRCQYHQEALCGPGGPETEKRQKYSPAKGKKKEQGAPVAWLVRIQTGCGLEPASYKRHSLIISYPAADPENYCSDGIIPGCLA